MTYPFLAGLRLDVENPALIPAGKVLNRIKNPSGSVPGSISVLLGGYGWVTPGTGAVSHTTLPGTIPVLRFTTAASGPAYFQSEPGVVTAGSPYCASWNTSNFFDNFWYRATIQWLDSAGAVIASTATGVIAGNAGAQTMVAGVMPATPVGASQVRIRFDVYGSAGGANPTSALAALFRDVKMAPGTDPADIVDGPFFTNILNSSASINIEREALNVGTLTAVIPDAAFDPATNGLLRPGRAVRLVATHEPAGGGPGTGEHVIFTGEATTAAVSYDPTRTDARRGVINLTAVDATTRLANAIRPNGVASVDDLRAVLEGAGVPWRINGSRSQTASAAAVTRNESASALDQIAVVRDSVHGYAWVSRDGVFNAWDAGVLDPVPAVVLDETDYTASLDVAFDTERCINTVSIKLLRKNLANGETVEVPYGPFLHPESRAEWGPRAAEFTVQGLTDSLAAMQAFADEVFAANAEPQKRVNSLSVVVADQSDVTDERALLDLYDLVQVTNLNGLDQTARVTRLSHRITTAGWLVTLGFEAEGGVAAPQATPPVQNGGQGGSVRYPGPQGGAETVSGLITGTAVTHAVVFPEEFPATPTVVVSPNTGSPENFDVAWTSRTPTGFTINVTRRAGASTGLVVTWIAL